MDNLTRRFYNRGLSYSNHKPSNSLYTGYRVFRAMYGVSPNTCRILWNLIVDKPEKAKIDHLLWCLLFLKTYSTESISSALVGVNEKTFRLWTWKFVDLLAKIDVIKWENRLKNRSSNITVSLDGTDYRINEPQPFNKKWFSHKFKAAGIRYEIGLSINSGEIVWASGGFPCGEWPDIEIAKTLYVYLSKNEITLADKGYRGLENFKLPTNLREKRILARHETLNGRLKNFNILCHRYRHPLIKHPSVFHACVRIVQISIENGETLFQI